MVVDVGEVRLRRPARLRRAHLPPRGRDARSSTSTIELEPRPAAVDATPTPSGCSRSSRTCSRTPSSSPQHGQVDADASSRRRAAGARTTRSSNRAADGGRVRGRATPASASRRTSSRSSSRRSSRPTAAPAASTAARAWAWRSAARSSRLLGGEIRLVSDARPGAARSRSTCRRRTRRRGRRASRPRPSRRPAPPAPPRPAGRGRGRERPPAPGRPTPAAEPGAGAARQRGRRRPRRHPARRPRAADRRERPRLRPLPARRGPREGLQGAGHVARGRRAGAWRASTSPTPSRSTSACRTSTAGACWTGSRTTSATRHIPVCVDLDRRGPRAGAGRRGAWRSSPSRSRPRTSLDELLDRPQRLRRPAGQATCWWSSRTTSRARADRSS